MEEKERKEGPKVLHVTQAPPPITPLSGTGGWTSRRPNPTQIPPNPPTYFPLDLWPKTCVILAEAVKKFPDRKHQMPELCKHYISEMTPLFCGAVEAGTMKAGAVLQEGLGGMQDLLRSLLVYDDDGPHSGFGDLSNEAYQIYQEARNSEQWRKLARAIADAKPEAPASAPEGASKPKPPSRDERAHPAPEQNEQQTWKVERGRFCNQVIDEIKRIKNLAVGTGRSVAEIEKEHPDFAVWKVRTTLGPEDQETFNHPNQWGPTVGYAKMVLSKTHGKSRDTISSWVKAYRKGQKKKKA